MKAVTAADAGKPRPGPVPQRMAGITSGVRVLLTTGAERFYPRATSYVYVGDWLFVDWDRPGGDDDEGDTLATIERERVVAVEAGDALEGEG